MKIKLNEQQILGLADALASNPGDHVPDECEIEIRDVCRVVRDKDGLDYSARTETRLLLDGNWLHQDGEFATWPDAPGDASS